MGRRPKRAIPIYFRFGGDRAAPKLASVGQSEYRAWAPFKATPGLRLVIDVLEVILIIIVVCFACGLMWVGGWEVLWESRPRHGRRGPSTISGQPPPGGNEKGILYLYGTGSGRTPKFPSQNFGGRVGPDFFCSS